MTFIVTYQNVWTTTSNGYPYSASMLEEFRTYWKKNNSSVVRDIAHLFTGKYIGIGCAWRPGLGTDYAYAISGFGTEMQYTVTHEIGHNLDADDANLMNPVPPECLCGTSSRSVMCQGSSNLWFCQTSINQINPFLASNSTLLTGSFPANRTLSGTVNGFNVYQATQKITSNQVINSGYTVYKAKEVELGNDFEVKLGAEFEIIIDDNDCP